MSATQQRIGERSTGMGVRFGVARDAFRTRLWPTPTLAVLFALLLGLTVPKLDSVIDDHLPRPLDGWLFSGDADAARSLLGAISSSMITVTALTFSLTVVTLQLASSQFSPRLLRTFTRDRFVQVTLALFLATFTFALTVLRAVRGAGGGDAELVPQVAVTLTFLLAVASVLALVLFLGHLTEQIRVETMLRDVHRDAVATMRAVLGEGDSSEGSAVVPPPVDAQTLLAEDDGFLTWVDREKLLRIAVEERAVVSLAVCPGEFIVTGTPLGSVWAAGGGRLSSEADERIARRVPDCIHVGFERTSAQDVGFGLRQLTDVVNKALSPGINDPTTAIHALGHISAFLCELSGRHLGPELVQDEDEDVRLVLSRPDFADYVNVGISQPRRYGGSDPDVLLRICQVLLDLSYRVSSDQRLVVRQQLARLRATAEDQRFDAVERAGLDSMALRVEQVLARPAASGSVPRGTDTRDGNEL